MALLGVSSRLRADMSVSDGVYFVCVYKFAGLYSISPYDCVFLGIVGLASALNNGLLSSPMHSSVHQTQWDEA